MEANIIRAKLEDSGFACFLADENVATLNPFYNQAIGGVKLIVFEHDVEAINELLKEDLTLVDEADASGLVGNDEGIVCEKCGSHHVSYGMATQKKHSWWVIAISFLLGGVYPFKGNKCYHCYDYGYEFE